MGLVQIANDIQRTAEIFLGKGNKLEIRAFKGKQVLSGIFNDKIAFCQAASIQADAVYFTPNPVNLPVTNKLIFGGKCATDHDIVSRNWILIDIDPVRSPGTMATANERAIALEVTNCVRDYLIANKVVAPIIASSGSGGHIVLRAEWGLDHEPLIKDFLNHLSDKFSSSKVKIDTSVHNLSRIWKVYGTWSKKGTSTTERPHRQSALIDVPPTILPNSVDVIKKIIYSNQAKPQLTPLEAITRAKAYIDTIPGAIAGQNGDDATYKVACKLMIDFGLPEYDALPIFMDWNKKCSPPWAKKDLIKKLRHATKYGKGQPGSKILQRPANTRKQLNQLNFNYLLENVYLIVGTTEVFDNKLGLTMKLEALRSLYPVETKPWLESNDKKIILPKNIVFAPQGCEKNQLNLFRGMKIKPKEGNIPTVIEHISHLCNHDPGLARWVTSWLAYPLQHPGASLATSLVFHGLPGTGKNIFFDAIVAIYGEYGITIGQNQLEARFTDWLSKKCFILCDEVFSHDNLMHVKNRIKSMITEKYHLIEFKGLTVRLEENHSNFVFLSNNRMPVHIEPGDRRFCVIEVNEVHEPDYYAQIASELQDLGVLYNYLLQYDTGDFHPDSKPPLTQAKKELGYLSEMSCQRFLRLWVAGELPIPYQSAEFSHLWEFYRDWCYLEGEKGVTGKRFAAEINNWITTKKLPNAEKIHSNGIKIIIANNRYLEQFADLVRDFRQKIRNGKI